MIEKLKKLVSLLCIIAMLSVISAPVYAGGEGPFDSDNNTGQSEGSESSDSDSDSGSTETSFTGTVYIGSGGIIGFIGQAFYAFYVHITGIDISVKDEKATRGSGSGAQS